MWVEIFCIIALNGKNNVFKCCLFIIHIIYLSAVSPHSLFILKNCLSAKVVKQLSK